MLISTRSDLTVEEHIRIFSDLKCLSKVNKEVVNDLASGVDLLKKLKKQAKTLSGGQKRKLQMAIMQVAARFVVWMRSLPALTQSLVAASGKSCWPNGSTEPSL
jgi:ABC-type Na+ transport system ATPase subunit NatA